ncbi:MAG TPA: type VI secretion system baseplate subunit TssF [Gemmatimonadaceae bacterium]|nr:type VI secretion system baseplate subunit TssF [Gemmatimonadaceae bacterium]
MREQLLHYYERELAYLRRMGAEFGQRYPKIAGRLLLEPNKCDDPHVERMLEAFAFLAARVHLRIDDDFPEISEALLNVVYPHYVRPIPSMSLAELRLDPDQGRLASGYRVPRDTMVYSRPVEGVPCKFKTCFDTTLWPITVTAAQWVTPDRLRPAARLGDAVAALRLELRCFQDLAFAKLPVSSLRLHLNGEGNLVSALYELLCNNSRTILVREIPPGDGPGATQAGPMKTVTLPAGSLQPAGFGPDEGMLPYPGQSFQAYRLLQEYFTFPEKFLFVDLRGFQAIRAAGLGRAIEVIVPVAPFERVDWRPMLEAGVTASTIRVGCTPIVNLFPQVSEPIPLTQRRHEYPVVPDARRRLTTEIFSIDEVVAVTPGSRDPLRCEPFHGHRHGGTRGDEGAPTAYWLARRQPSGWRSDSGTDVVLSFVDLSGSAVHPERDVATARLTCFNSDLPSRLPFGNPQGDFTLESGGPIREIVALVKPTHVVQPPLGGPQLWRLISQLSLNYLSLTDGPDSLREILRLHDFSDSPVTKQQIDGITDVRSAPAFARIASEFGLSFARGRRVDLELDEERFAGGGVFLFASVLEQFLGLYASLNSFSILVARTRQRKAPLREWPPRAGWKPLL